ncbi:MAG: acyltransferase [Eggerthellaceae bacterium]|nr:acyltransferase [Eggerthellaceae bacterium]
MSGGGKKSLSRAGRLNTSWSLISEYRNVLFGLAIAAIILFHLYESTLSGTLVHAALWPFSRLSAAVDVFLFLSGVGLRFSLAKGGAVRDFYKKRLIRVVPTFLVVAIPFYLLKDVLVGQDGAKFFLELTNIAFLVDGYRQFWYVYAIILFYLIYPPLHRFLNAPGRSFGRTCLVIGASAVVAMLIGLLSPELLENTEIMLARFPVFVAGAYAGILVRDGRRIELRQILMLIGMTAVLFALALLPDDQFGFSQLAIRYFFSCVSVLACVLLPVLLKRLGCSPKQKLLTSLGAASLELYIVNVAVRTIVSGLMGDYFFGSSVELIQLEYCLLVVALTLACGFALHRAMAPINNRLLRM